MRIFSLGLVLICSLLIVSCSKKYSSLPLSPVECGSAKITFTINKTGALAKSIIELDKLYISLSAPGETVIRDTFALSGNGLQTVTATYNNLASLLKSWTLAAESRDMNGIVIHSGETSFIVPAHKDTAIALSLSAQYSMLAARFFPVRDSVTRCVLTVDNAVRGDSSFAKQACLGDTIALGYDYLSASPLGANHVITMKVYGQMWGFDTLLYSGSTPISVVSGVDATCNLTLYWVGPALPPPGQATMSVVLGAVGTVKADGWLKDESFSATGSLAALRVSAALVRLQSGKILICGGSDGATNLSSCELYDPSTGMWTPTASMTAARQGHSATLLPDGKVLVSGGWGNLASAELFDPVAGTWTATGSLALGRGGHSAVLLQTGKVLIAGGGVNGSGDTYGQAGAEVYDPATGTWSTTGALNVARMSQQCVLLGDGKVLVAGGIPRGVTFDNFSSAELYDPATATWSMTGSMAVGRREGFTLSRLNDGRVLVAGGATSWTVNPTTLAEVYDPSTGGWTPTTSLPATRAYHAANVLANGKVLVSGGQAGAPAATRYNTALIYDPDAMTWTQASSLMTDYRAFHYSITLSDGKAFIIGGYDRSSSILASAEIYGR